ncbi:MAG: hypothetical protein EOO39_12150 [Cytophagaceae bacterium]|nr:MAG: hypothetical protein EOO39_12150 [Cytophagaceae bacterium]
MTLKIISGVLILVTAFLSVKHGWGGISGNVKPEEAKMMADLEISQPVLLIISVMSLAVGGLVLFPQTFFVGNLLNATTILLIMAYALRVDNLKIALIEIPFLLMPLLLIWLGHPFRN